MEPESFSLPAPIPQWPPGQGFAAGRINLGQIEVLEIRTFKFIWGYNLSYDLTKGVSFYEPVGIPKGFHIFGHYCQSNVKPLRGFVLAARDVGSSSNPDLARVKPPALVEPLDYTLIWSSNGLGDEDYGGCGFFWLPQAPEGYKPMGYVITNTPGKPPVSEVRCVRADLTDKSEAYKAIVNATSKFSDVPIWVWNTRPSHRGILGRGVLVGTFLCSTCWVAREELDCYCLINLDQTLRAMPNVDQIHALINHYGPTIFFHPNELFLPSSVSWFFENGALLYRKGSPTGEAIEPSGSNLPSGGANDGEFWIDLPDDDRRNITKHGNLQSSKLYAHIKPALGGIFTDIAMWIFCPFNGPATIKLGICSIALGKIGQHVCDWEHFTLRISNFTGELWSIYFSQHSGGEWIDAYDLEFIQGNKAVIYSSKCGHASYPRPGTYLQGSARLGLGIRNDAARSDLFVDSSVQYEIIAAEYLGDGAVAEPGWLQFMREWGPKIVYDSRTELDKILNRFPVALRYSAASIIRKLPVELYGEEGPTGPKEKNNWMGDERG